MEKYRIRFFFGYGDSCLWSGNNKTREKYNYPIYLEELPISPKLARLLSGLNNEHFTSLDWSDPAAPSPWTERQIQDFMYRASMAYECIKSELEEDFEVVNELAGTFEL